MITKQLAVAPSDMTPTRWLKFLDEIDVDPEFLQRLAGYCLTGSTREQKIFFLWGEGHNGKSVFLDTLAGLFGAYHRKVPAAALMLTGMSQHSAPIASLSAARLVTGTELEKGQRWNTSLLKDLSGGEQMTANFMRQNNFDFRPQLKLLIAGNNRPSLGSVDQAIRRRMVLIPFLQDFESRRDDTLGDTLVNEWAGILQWAVDGALDWQLNGLDIPGIIKQASDAYLDDEDLLGQFLTDCVEKATGSFVTTTALHDANDVWRREQGLTPWSARALQGALVERGMTPKRTNQGRGFVGLKLLPNAGTFQVVGG